ncbi:glycerate kinase (plasmid) [Paenarthrobacter ureafaciens]
MDLANPRPNGHARVLIASDKFKGSLSSREVAAHLTAGLRSVHPDVQIKQLQVADGGEGTVKAVISAGFSSHLVQVSGPTGRPVVAEFATRGNEAVIEMANAAGLALLPRGASAPLTASSRGVGELVCAALDLGCNKIIIGAGGSACTDGGAGLLAALGAEFLDAKGQPLHEGGGFLMDLASVNLDNLDKRLRRARFVLATDVNNPLLGPEGAAAIFAPQKGATMTDIARLEAGLEQLVASMEQEIGPRAIRAAAVPGAGSAGGLGYAAIAVLAAQTQPGVVAFQNILELNHYIADSTLVITGEGNMDEQSLGGKLPLGISRIASEHGVPVIAVCGNIALDASQVELAGFTRAYSLRELQPDLSRCINQAGPLLEQIGSTIGSDLHKLGA